MPSAGHVDETGDRSDPHAAVRVGVESGHLGLGRLMEDWDGGKPTAGIAFQTRAAADPEVALAVEFDRIYLRAAEQVLGHARRRGLDVQGEDPVVAPQPERPQSVLCQSVAIQRAWQPGFPRWAQNLSP